MIEKYQLLTQFRIWWQISDFDFKSYSIICIGIYVPINAAVVIYMECILLTAV